MMKGEAWVAGNGGKQQFYEECGAICESTGAEGGVTEQLRQRAERI